MSIVIKTTKSTLSSNGGLAVFEQLEESVHLRQRLSGLLPVVPKATTKAMGMIHGFVAEAECLDDLARLGEDEAFKSVVAKPYSAKSYGNYLRSFSQKNLKDLQRGLIDLSADMRHVIDTQRLGKDKSFARAKNATFDFDSTINEQFGLKMEGVEMTYKGIAGYDTFKAYDDLGLPYWDDVRPGATKSGSGVAEVVHAVFYKLRNDPRFKGYRFKARGDSAFSTFSFFNACSASKVGFVVRLHANMLETVIDHVRHWQTQNPKKENRIRFYDGRECEIGQTFYTSPQCAEAHRVVVIRSLKDGIPRPLIAQTSDYDYWAWITNIGEHEYSGEDVIRFYRKRGHSENFIKDQKHGFDLKHYPCLKLVANRAYSLLGAYAYAMVRFVSLLRNFRLPRFAKLLRFEIVRLPAIIVRHGRRVTFRFMPHHAQEVEHTINAITSVEFGYSKQLSG